MCNRPRENVKVAGLYSKLVERRLSVLMEMVEAYGLWFQVELLGSFETQKMIDAREFGNDSRFINHSRSPNLEVEKWYVSGIPRLGFFVPKVSKKGEQLTSNSKNEYLEPWTRGERVRRRRWFCGGSNCSYFF